MVLTNVTVKKLPVLNEMASLLKLLHRKLLGVSFVRETNLDIVSVFPRKY